MARIAIWKKKGLSPEEIISVYEESTNLPEAASHFSVTEKTLRNWLDSFGYERKRGFPKGQQRYDTSCLAEWIRNNPDTPLPWSPKEAAALTGCSERSVSSYLYRRREALRSRIEALPDLRLTGKTLKAGGASLPVSEIKSYTILMREHSYRVKMKGTLRSGREFSMITTIDYLESLINQGEGQKRLLEENLRSTTFRVTVPSCFM